MKTASSLLLLFSFSVSLLGQTGAPIRNTLVLTHVTVIDCTGGPPLTDITVVISNERITALGPSNNVSSPSGAQAVDATRKFLIPGLWEWVKSSYRLDSALIGKMRRAGVEFLAGTDAITDFCFPGFSLHDELSLLVEAGLSPMEALQAATRNPAVFLGIQDSLGTVEKGKLADLVLLDANPLDDIRNTQKINAVIVRGRLLNRRALDELLAQAEAAAVGK